MLSSGVFHYGVAYARAMQEQASVVCLSLLNERSVHSSVVKNALTSVDYRTLSFETNWEKILSVNKIVRWAKEFSPDIIHFSDGCDKPVYGALLFPMLSTIAPMCVTVHEPVEYSDYRFFSYERRAIQAAYRRVSHCFVHGPWGKAKLTERGISGKDISIVHHGVLDYFDRGSYRETRREGRTILLFGHLRQRKGIHRLLEIAENIHSRCSDATFIVAGAKVAWGARDGTPGWSLSLEQLMKDMRAKTYFEVYEGFVPDERVEYFFRRASVTLLPYFEASQSGVPMIAMPLGSVVVATNVGDLPHVITHNETGILCDSTVDSITEAVCGLLSDRQHRERLAENARAFSLSACSWQHITRHMLETYKKVLNAKQSAHS